MAAALTRLGAAIAALCLAGARPAFCENARFEVAHPAPIHQDITRAAILARTASGPRIFFSTLESFHRNPAGDRFLWISRDLTTGATAQIVFEGSTEARSYAYSDKLKRYVLGASLDPQIFLFDPQSGAARRVFKGPTVGAWNHRIAVHGDFAYAVMSSAVPTVPGYDGVVRINLRSGQWNVVSFKEKLANSYGGAETVDPTGRVWFYRAYPVRRMWADTAGGVRDRALAGAEGWTVESWDEWDGDFYAVMSNSRRELSKKRVDLKALRILPDRAPPQATALFLKLVRVDLYHADPADIPALYFDPAASEFYERPAGKSQLGRLGAADFGLFDVMGFHNKPQEGAARWRHPRYGEIEVLGHLPGRGLVVWLRGRRTYAFVDLKSGKWDLHTVPGDNLSAAAVTALATDAEGRVYGGGYLTMTHLFRFDPKTGAHTVLREAVPHSEGQVNSLFSGRDGRIYGAAYPDAVLFRYDPKKPWKPGRGPDSNPVNLGPTGHRRQTRAFRGALDSDGRVWYQSVTDYEEPVAHALSRADFDKRELVVKTDLDDGFARADDVAVFDERHVLVLGSRDRKPGLYLVDQREFKIVREKNLETPGGVLATQFSRDGKPMRRFLAQGREILEIMPDLSLFRRHRAAGHIARILNDGEGRLILVGLNLVEKWNPRGGASEVWWNDESPGVFSELTWTPAVYSQGAVYVAQDEKLMRFHPARP